LCSASDLDEVFYVVVVKTLIGVLWSVAPVVIASVLGQPSHISCAVSYGALFLLWIMQDDLASLIEREGRYDLVKMVLRDVYVNITIASVIVLWKGQNLSLSTSFTGP
jgi:hypothetical protein